MQNLDYNPHKHSTRRNIVITSIFCVLLGGAFWFSLNSTLDQMTKRDCEAGIQKACNALR